MNKNSSKVERLISKYKKILLLQDWDIDFILHDKDESDGAAADIHSDFVYRNATINIYKCAFVKPNCIKHIIIHELCHCITEPLVVYCYDFLNGRFRTGNEIQDAREFMTERIAKIVNRLQNEN